MIDNLNVVEFAYDCFIFSLILNAITYIRLITLITYIGLFHYYIQ